MRPLFALLIILLVFSCNQEEPQATPSNTVDLTQIEFDDTSIALVGDSQKIASTWEAYTSFMTSFENFDQGQEAALRLAQKASEMRLNIPVEFDVQPVRSRILVLQTRASQYASFLGYNNRPMQGYKDGYAAIVKALDHLNSQLNEVSIYAAQEQELYEQLKNDLAQPSDSISIDSLP